MIEPVFANRYGLLHQGDCMDVFAAMRDRSVSCVFADPPFNLGKVYGKGEVSDSLATRDYLKWAFAWLDESIRVLRAAAPSSSTSCRCGATALPGISKSRGCSSGIGSPSR